MRHFLILALFALVIVAVCAAPSKSKGTANSKNTQIFTKKPLKKKNNRCTISESGKRICKSKKVKRPSNELYYFTPKPPKQTYNTGAHNLLHGVRQPGDSLLHEEVVREQSKIFRIGSVTTQKLVRVGLGCLLTRIEALDLKTDGTGGFANILKGGVGNSQAVISFKSQRGHGLGFSLRAYGICPTITLTTRPTVYHNDEDFEMIRKPGSMPSEEANEQDEEDAQNEEPNENDANDDDEANNDEKSDDDDDSNAKDAEKEDAQPDDAVAETEENGDE